MTIKEYKTKQIIIIKEIEDKIWYEKIRRDDRNCMDPFPKKKEFH